VTGWAIGDGTASNGGLDERGFDAPVVERAKFAT